MDKIHIPIIHQADFLQDQKVAKFESPQKNISLLVQKILEKVKLEGDKALFEMTAEYDRVSSKKFCVDKKLIQSSLEKIDSKTRQILEKAIENIQEFHQKQLPSNWFIQRKNGNKVGQLIKPIVRAGIYIPGGKAAYPSTVLMNVIPAQIARVSSIAICSPPSSDGMPHPLILACCALLNIEEIYALGGAQAVAAMAYGTESIPPVKKITGPGNAFVAEAKKQVFGLVGIDSIAGPTELTILHDQVEVKSEWVAKDLMAQAEHDEQASVFLITTSENFAQKVQKDISDLAISSSRQFILEHSLNQNSKIILVENQEQGVELVNYIAPEHLQIMVQDEENCVSAIKNAGAIFVGKWTTTAVGDYFAGPNHTLPTNATACFSSPLSVYDFFKYTSYIHYCENGMKEEASSIAHFAEIEGLIEHANSVKARLENES